MCILVIGACVFCGEVFHEGGMPFLLNWIRGGRFIFDLVFHSERFSQHPFYFRPRFSSSSRGALSIMHILFLPPFPNNTTTALHAPLIWEQQDLSLPLWMVFASSLQWYMVRIPTLLDLNLRFQEEWRRLTCRWVWECTKIKRTDIHALKKGKRKNRRGDACETILHSIFYPAAVYTLFSYVLGKP